MALGKWFRLLLGGMVVLASLAACGEGVLGPVVLTMPPATIALAATAVPVQARVAPPHSTVVTLPPTPTVPPTPSVLPTPSVPLPLPIPTSVPGTPTVAARPPDATPPPFEGTPTVIDAPPVALVGCNAPAPEFVSATSADGALPAQEFQGRLQALIDDYQQNGRGVAGVAITQDGGLPVVALCADRTFATASLYKLFVLWGVQRAIADGDLTDDTLLTFLAEDDDSEEDGYTLWNYGERISVAELRDLMITTSNNSAAWILARTVGWGTIDALLRERGFAVSRAANGVSTPNEIARFFDEVLARTLDPSLRPSDYTMMLALLGDQRINGYLSAGFPPDADFAHKTGNLPGVVNDAGILTLPDGRVVTVVVLTEGDEWASFGLMEELAALVWEYYGE